MARIEQVRELPELILKRDAPALSFSVLFLDEREPDLPKRLEISPDRPHGRPIALRKLVQIDAAEAIEVA